MTRTIPCRVQQTYERRVDGKWFAYCVINGTVFRNAQAFDTKLEAYRFNLVTKREGALIKGE